MTRREFLFLGFSLLGGLVSLVFRRATDDEKPKEAMFWSAANDG